MSNPEIARLQIELSWAERHIDELHSATEILLDAIDYYREMAAMHRRTASVSRDCADHAMEENQRLGDMNVSLAAELEEAGLLFYIGSPMDDLRLVDAQIKALTEHRRHLLEDEVSLL